MPVAAALAVLVLVCIGMGFRRLVQAVRLQDMPLSRNRSAAQGMVELQGIASVMPGPPIVAPLSKTACVWWHYRITRAAERGDGTGEVEVIADETSSDCFHLADATGTCIVDPVGAKVLPTLSREWRGTGDIPDRIPQPGWDAFFTFGRYRYTEKIISLGELLFVHGFFRTQAAVVAQGEARDVADLLSEWKHDRRALLRRFDANHDGQIDGVEWETARAAALDEVHRRYLDQAASPDISVIGPPPAGGDFLISAVRRPAVIRRYERQAIGFMLAALLLTSVLVRSLQLVRQLAP